MSKNSTVRYVVCSDVTPNRCTVQSIHRSEDDAREALERDGDDTWRIYEAEADSLLCGERAYHADGSVWS